MSKSISYGNLILIMKNDVMYQYMCVHKIYIHIGRKYEKRIFLNEINP